MRIAGKGLAWRGRTLPISFVISFARAHANARASNVLPPSGRRRGAGRTAVGRTRRPGNFPSLGAWAMACSLAHGLLARQADPCRARKRLPARVAPPAPPIAPAPKPQRPVPLSVLRRDHPDNCIGSTGWRRCSSGSLPGNCRQCSNRGAPTRGARRETRSMRQASRLAVATLQYVAARPHLNSADAEHGGTHNIDQRCVKGPRLKLAMQRRSSTQVAREAFPTLHRATGRRVPHSAALL
jgi:hypothetical protein